MVGVVMTRRNGKRPTTDAPKRDDGPIPSSVISRRQFGGLAAGAFALASGLGTASAKAGVDPDIRETEQFCLDGLKRPATIRVDQWGVPHMYAEDLEDVSFVQGFNAARDRLWQIDIWRRQGIGELSAVLGERTVEDDRAARLFMYRGDIEPEWEAYGPDAEAIATGFACGINAYIDQALEDPELMPPEFEALDYEPAKWDPEDVVRMRTHAISLNVSDEVARAETIRDHGFDVEAVRERLEPDWEIEIPEGLDLDVIPDGVLDVYWDATGGVSFTEDDVRNPDALEGLSVEELGAAFEAPDVAEAGPDRGEAAGSNNWAVAPEISATGRPIVANDPHRSHGVPSLRYIEHISSPEVDSIGAGEPGLPGISIGHNGKTAFGLTIFYIDQEDLYVYETNPDDPTEYCYEGDWEAMDVETETVEVRDGEDREIELKFTRHGPVIYEDPDENVAFAVRTVWTEPGTTAYFGSVGYMRADDIEEFEEAMNGELTEDMLGWGTPPENQVAADTDGNIGWFPGGRTPVRENWDGLLPVPGDGTYEWDGFLEQSQLPSEVNPDRGWVATANAMVMPDDYVELIREGERPPIGFEWVSPWRQLRVEEVLEEFEDDGGHDLEDSTALQLDNISVIARRTAVLLERLEHEDELVNDAIELLAAWDGSHDRDSAAAALYQNWSGPLHSRVTTELVGEEAYQDIGTGDDIVMLEALEEPEEWFDEDPVDTRDELLLATLEDAVEATVDDHGENIDDWAWGNDHVAHFQHQLSALVDADDILDVGPAAMDGVSTAPNAQWGDVSGGASWRMVVDVGEWDNSLAINTPGQSGDPESKFYDNLFDMWVNGEFFPLVYSDDAVQRNTVKQIELRPDRGGPPDHAEGN